MILLPYPPRATMRDRNPYKVIVGAADFRSHRLALHPNAAMVLSHRHPVSPFSRTFRFLGCTARNWSPPHPGFSRAFGVAWERDIAPEHHTGMLQRRWTWHLRAAPAAQWQRDLPF
jgi:hypothetical protein